VRRPGAPRRDRGSHRRHFEGRERRRVGVPLAWSVLHFFLCSVLHFFCLLTILLFAHLFFPDFLLERLLSKIEGCDYESLLFLRTMQARARARIVEQLDTKCHATSRAEARERCAFSRRHALVLRILLQWRENNQSSGSRESRARKEGGAEHVAAFSYHELFSLPDPASRGAASREGGTSFLSFMYRYISRESCSQFDSLPLTSLTILSTPPRAKEAAASTC